MKKHLLIGSALLAAISTFSQNSARLRPTGLLNTKILAETKFGNEGTSSVIKSAPVKPTVFPTRNASKTSVTNTWQNVSASMNIYGVIISYCKPLQWNDELNAVSFVHRKSPTYTISPAPPANAENGSMVALISTNCGLTWDSTAIFADNNFWARYPGGAIYNPPPTPPSTVTNTDINNAYIVGAGPTTGNGNVTWIGNWYASKKLGTANYNNIPSTAVGAQQIMPTTGTLSPNVPSRHDFAAYGFTATDDGKMRVLAGITDDVLTSDTAVMLMTGTFNSTGNVFDWAGRVFDPPTTSQSDGSENWTSRPIMAWNEDGTVGYVVIIGSRIGATQSNVGLQPIVYKTTNSGGTWSLENSINFNASAYNALKNRLWAVSADTTLIVPNFSWLEGIDCTVDANNKLHIFSSILGHFSNHPDSLNFISQWTSEEYLWPHVPIVENGLPVHPFLYDFIYDGTATTPSWSHILIDSMSTEGPSGTTTGSGYQDNPWDPDPSNSNGKTRVDARLQMSRTPDGKHLLYTWSESDTAFTDNQKKWNNLPNIKARLMDVTTSELSPTEIDVTVDADGEIANRAMYHFISPKFKLAAKTQTLITVNVPMTVSNSNPYSQLTPNRHWYSCAEFQFQRPIDVGISENNPSVLNSASLFPNPAKNNVKVKVGLSGSSKIQIDVLNTMGQVVKTVRTQGQIGNNTLSVDLVGLSSGIYLVNVKADNTGITKKLVVE